jgi:F-box/leucine-rich repeat protein 2/20
MCVLLTDEALKDIFLHSKDLRVLCTHSCEKITGESFYNVKDCENLEVLDLSYCSNLSDVALQYISEYCPKLIHLDISGCSLIGSDGLSAVYRHCSKLEKLRLMLCDQPSLTPECLADITKFAQAIKVLELTGVRQLTDASAEKIARYGSQIQFLAMNGCVDITDRAVSAIGKNCTQLRVVEFCACKKVTVQSLLDVIHTVKTLTRMVISECSISDSELEILRKYSSRCSILKHGPGEKEKKSYYVMYTKTGGTKPRRRVAKPK